MPLFSERRVATAEWSCHPYVGASGWAPVGGTLTETAAGYCAVVDVKPSQEFGIYGTSTAGYPGSPYVNVYTAATWTTLFNYLRPVRRDQRGHAVPASWL